MRSSNHRKKNRPYQIKKRGIRDDYIDKQIWVLHQAMVNKLLAQPELIVQVKATLEQRFEQGKIGRGAFITWISLMEIADDVSAFKNGILEQTDKMRRLRRQTPLVGILTEEERQQALMADAIGEINNMDVLTL